MNGSSDVAVWRTKQLETLTPVSIDIHIMNVPFKLARRRPELRMNNDELRTIVKADPSQTRRN